MGALTALLNLAENIFDCLYCFGEDLEIVDDFYVVTKKINKLLNLKEEKRENYLYDLNGDIIFSNVTVFVNDKPILEHMNFIIKKGENIAIIGENGSGKSILAKTILGFYKYEGNIYINNHNIKGLNKQDIRKYVELILGESYMFSGSILENIKLDNKISEDQVEKVIKDCEIKDDIDRFKDGYNTLIGEKGTKLSGGQKQRVCVARSIVNNKPFVIFDEALNKLDNETRRNVLVNLISECKSNTLIFISNDLEIIDYVDCVIYIDGNTTVKGAHKELLERNESYKRLIEISKNVI